MRTNVYGNPLHPCSLKPLTGWRRNGMCESCSDDPGQHTLCAVLTTEFLSFTAYHGNDLTTPIPEIGFPGLNPGDRWCLCVSRWVEAFRAGCAPPVVLEATDASVLAEVDLDVLERFAATDFDAS